MKKVSFVSIIQLGILALLTIISMADLGAQNVVDGPGKLLFKTGKSLNQHLKVVPASELGSSDVWQFEEMEDGNVILKCPTRGYLVAGAGHNNIFNLGYHQNAQTATRFKPQTRSDGYKTYQWVSSNPLHRDRYLGDWRNMIVLKKGGPSAAHLKIVSGK